MLKEKQCIKGTCSAVIVTRKSFILKYFISAHLPVRITHLPPTLLAPEGDACAEVAVL